jgi:hypothetical protein
MAKRFPVFPVLKLDYTSMSHRKSSRKTEPKALASVNVVSPEVGNFLITNARRAHTSLFHSFTTTFDLLVERVTVVILSQPLSARHGIRATSIKIEKVKIPFFVRTKLFNAIWSHLAFNS